MSVLIGHASIDENGKAHGGQSGDQTGKEVCTRYWWAGGWDVLLRAKNPEVAEKMAVSCETLCKSNLVGYDQWQRNTLWDELEKVGWDASKLKTKCETDCSAFMTACARCAGINVPRVRLANGGMNAPVTSTMKNAFFSTGAFDVQTGCAQLNTDAGLRRGDILVRSTGHTVMVLSDSSNGGNKITMEVAKYSDARLVGTYVCTAFALNVRSGAGTSCELVGNLRKGDEITCDGRYTTVGTVRWLYITNAKGLRGFASERCLQKRV